MKLAFFLAVSLCLNIVLAAHLVREHSARNVAEQEVRLQREVAESYRGALDFFASQMTASKEDVFVFGNTNAWNNTNSWLSQPR